MSEDNMDEQDSLIERLEKELNDALTTERGGAVSAPSKKELSGKQQGDTPSQEDQQAARKPLPALRVKDAGAADSPSVERKSPRSGAGKQLPGAVPVLPVVQRSPREESKATKDLASSPRGGEASKSPTAERKVLN
jgi:hypothetical protein